MKRVYLFSLLLLTTACKVGPNYHEPETSMPLAFSEERKEESAPVEDEDLFHWWTAFNDPFLNELLQETVDANFDYRIALQNVYQARSQYWIQFTQILPELDFDAQATRYRASQSFPNALSAGSSTNTNQSSASPSSSTITPPPVPPIAVPATPTISPIQNFFQIGFDVIWQIDVFGGLRRAAEAAYDSWEAQVENARNVKIIVLSEVANTYVAICALQKQRTIAREVVLLDENLLQLFSSLFEAGLANEETVMNARATLARDAAILKVNQILLNQTIYSLAVLTGRWPESIIADFQIERPIPYAKGMIPDTLPSGLLRRRPDIRAAERELASATEQIGVAVADLYPNFSLIGSSSSFAANPLQGANIGYSSSSISKLFSSPSLIWGIGGLVTWPIFDFGRRFSAVDVQIFIKNQAYLNYQKTVIAALQETEQALTAYFNEEERLLHLSRQADAYKRNYDLIADQFQSGLADYTQAVQAQEIWLSSVSSLVSSQQSLSSDLIAVYKALGGDW